MTRTGLFLAVALLISLSTQFTVTATPEPRHVPTIDQVLR